MTIEEIDLSLPNGFHDSKILGVRLDYVRQTAEIDLEIHVSGVDDEDTEKYQRATLSISGLIYFVIEPPGPPNTAHAQPSRVDGGSSELKRTAYPLPKPLPDGAFTYWFFVSNWNSFIHIAALTADIKLSCES